MKLRHALPAAALSFSACASLPEAKDSFFEEKAVIACEPGDREIIHLRQIHRSAEDDSASATIITASQKGVYAYLTALQKETGKAVQVVSEGYWEYYNSEVLESIYKTNSLSFFSKRSVDRLRTFKQLALKNYYKNQALLEVSTAIFKDVVPSDEFQDMIKELEAQVQKDEAWLESVTEDYEKRLDNAVKSNPWWAGGNLKCHIEQSCHIIPGEDKDLHTAVGVAQDDFGFRSPEYNLAQEFRDDEVIKIVDRNWSEEQGVMPVVFGAGHDFTWNTEKWNKSNPDKTPFCLTEVDTIEQLDLLMGLE